MRTALLHGFVLVLSLSAGGCATRGLTRPQASAALSLGSCCARANDASVLADSGASPAADACKCKADAKETCSCQMQGSSCGDGAKSCKATACKGSDCACGNLVCPTFEHAKSPGECDGNDRVGGGENHCKKK